MDAFDLAVEFILEREGGWVNDPHDPGGETHFGISKRAYPLEDIPNMTRERATLLYKRDYWETASCGEFPPAIGIALFDSAINQGVFAAIKLLQRSLSVVEDGVVGDETLEAAKRQNVRKVLRDFLRRRILRYARNPQAERFFRERTFAARQCLKLKVRFTAEHVA